MSRTRPAIAPNPYGEADDELDAPTLGLVVPVVGPAERVDKRGAASVRFAGSAPPSAGADHRVIASRPVGPGRPPIVATARKPGGEVGAMAEYPIQITKVQPPPLRADTLARDRLLDWLKIRIHRRVVLVLAEAGYGKTTLMADFSRRTRIRTFWYRLDRGDRDWVPFLAHIVASIRTHLPEFGSATDGLIRETGTTSPPLDVVLGTLMRELAGLPAEPAAFVLDDFHLVEDAPDIVRIVRELVSRGPERMSIVVVSRQTPDLQLARLRALGEVAELRTDDLRFDTTETSRLFRETYELRLDDALLAELSSRTEGWAASLQLVRTAIRDRSPSERRAFIHSISGAEGELYDYLAEEVIGDQPLELQQFLMRTSVLEQIDPELASVAATIPRAAARIAIDAGEALGLFGRRGTINRFHVRAHPLVRDFLQERLVRAVGPDGVATIHRAVAQVAESRDWRLAGHHYRAAGDMADARRVLAAAIETILATGAYAAAEELALSLPDDDPKDPTMAIVGSRILMQRGETAAGLERAEDAVRRAPRSDIALWNRLMVRVSSGVLTTLSSDHQALVQTSRSSIRLLTSQAVVAAIATSVSGSLTEAVALIERCISEARSDGSSHFLGVGLVNLAQLRRAQGQAGPALSAADEAIDVLTPISAGIELVSAKLAKAWALGHLGDLEGARAAYGEAITGAARPLEAAFEAADVEALYGDDARAWALLEPLRHLIDPTDDVGEQATATRITILLRRGRVAEAETEASHLRFGAVSTGIAFEARRLLIAAQLASATGRSDRIDLARRAVQHASGQGADLLAGVGHLLLSLHLQEASSDAIEVPISGPDGRRLMSILAEDFVGRIGRMSQDALGRITNEATVLPERWRGALRRALQQGGSSGLRSSAELLERIGEQADVDVLRMAARTHRNLDPGAGRVLARRLAPRVVVRDLGFVTVSIAGRDIEGAGLRRKVLALLCWLLTRPAMRASREEVLDALWPDADPDAALNSLNQTVYFLRRVFEPDYREDVSPGYVTQTTEMIWLDSELIDSASRVCRRLLRHSGAISDAALGQLAATYVGRFALDFAYEDWATGYRESLHAAYLHTVETAVRGDVDRGEFVRGVGLARTAAEVEPDSEALSVSLVRLYRLSGAHSAAAEQFGHYARVLRDLGVDPPAFEDV